MARRVLMRRTYQPRNPTGTDSPYNVLDAADLCFGTYTQPGTYKSRLRNIINNEARFLNVRNNLTMYSFDPIITDNGVTTLLLSDNKNYYRLKLDNSSDVGSITAQLQIAGFQPGNGHAACRSHKRITWIRIPTLPPTAPQRSMAWSRIRLLMSYTIPAPIPPSPAKAL